MEVIYECYASPTAANPGITATSSTACTDPTQAPLTEPVHAPGTQATAHAGQSTPVSVWVPRAGASPFTPHMVADDDDDDDDDDRPRK